MLLMFANANFLCCSSLLLLRANLSAGSFCLFCFSFRRGVKVKAEPIRFWYGARTNLEGDDQVDLLAHQHDELGSQLAREADLRVLCVRQQT